MSRTQVWTPDDAAADNDVPRHAEEEFGDDDGVWSLPRERGPLRRDRPMSAHPGHRRPSPPSATGAAGAAAAGSGGRPPSGSRPTSAKARPWSATSSRATAGDAAGAAKPRPEPHRTLGSAQVLGVKPACPHPLFFAQRDCGNINAFLHQQKAEHFGKYVGAARRQQRDNATAARGASESPTRPGSAGGASPPSPGAAAASEGAARDMAAAYMLDYAAACRDADAAAREQYLAAAAERRQQLAKRGTPTAAPRHHAAFDSAVGQFPRAGATAAAATGGGYVRFDEADAAGVASRVH